MFLIERLPKEAEKVPASQALGREKRSLDLNLNELAFSIKFQIIQLP